LEADQLFKPKQGAKNMHTTKTDLAEKLWENAFINNKARDPRSYEYQDGARAVLDLKIHDKPLKCPYTIGTAQADAWYAGTNEGHNIWRDFLKGI
jgi:hypothetical protein